jgi:hypothetical protein
MNSFISNVETQLSEAGIIIYNESPITMSDLDTSQLIDYSTSVCSKPTIDVVVVAQPLINEQPCQLQPNANFTNLPIVQSLHLQAAPFSDFTLWNHQSNVEC